MAGILTGLLVVIIQFLLSWNEYRYIENFKRLGIKEIRKDRDKREFYENLIKNSHKCIDVMGVTASRFMEHFADAESGRPETRVLLDAMNRKIKVRILVPKSEFLDRKEEKDNASKSKRNFENVKTSYPELFEYRYFQHVPAHGIVVVDDECIIGPIFPQLRSKDTPCIHMYNHSAYAQKYLDYFEDEWKKAT